MNLVENLFYKTRYLYEFSSGDVDPPEEHEDYDIYVDSGVLDVQDLTAEDHYGQLRERIGHVTVDERLSHSDCTLFRAVSEDTGELAGHGWALHPEDEVIWHDKVIARPSKPLVFNDGVFEEHRRRGVYSLIYHYRAEYIFNNLSDRFMVVVEASNEPVLEAYKKWGLQPEEPKAINKLVKLFGLNLYTILETDGERKRVFVPALDQFP